MFTPVPATQQFPEMERTLLDKWYSTGIIDGYLHKNNAEKKTFSFLDGPITANNPMGVHHAWGRTYKDLWQKFYNLLGYRQRFQSGFDCQGLWVEVEVEKELKLHNKKDIENLVPGDKKASIAKFVDLCRERVYKFSKVQTEQSKRLGYFMDWDNSYFTMNDENNYMIWQFISKCHKNGWVYKGHGSVPWCPRCETAISQHEMLTEDYKEVVHESVFIKLPVVGRKDEYLLVWTTTPWTIPANIAVAVDEKIEYSLVKGMTGKLFWIAKELVESLFEDKEAKSLKLKAQGFKVMKTVLGNELVGLKYTGPFDHLPAVEAVKKSSDKFHTVIATDKMIMPITTTEGTGLVHTAVSAGTEDFMLGKKRGLPMIPVINDDASYMEGFGELSGKNAKKHPELIIDFLKTYKGGEFLFSTLRYKHRYPACWRCKAELVWKVADEWYIAMDVKGTDGRTLRSRMIEVAKKINWIPGFGLERELDWLKNMHDWLISKKNRYWGLALPIYECESCKKFDVVESKEDLQKKAMNGWKDFEGHSPHKPFIDEVTIECKDCKKEMHRIDDVGNPWLDAGIVAYSTIKKDNKGEPLYLGDSTKGGSPSGRKKQWEEWFPADFITESFPGQFKNWFYSLIAMSTVMEDKPAFKTVLGFATCTGEDGRPMHKSWGNAIEFNEGAEKIGVDVMRWMYVTQNPAFNLNFGYKLGEEITRKLMIFWNTYLFFETYAEKKQRAEPKAQSNHILDRWIISRLNELVQQVTENLNKYDVTSAARAIEGFIIEDFSQWYIRRSRERFQKPETKRELKEASGTLNYVLLTLSKLIAPFAPFISEEIYKNLTKKESVHLEDWPKVNKKLINKKLNQEMEKTRKMVALALAGRAEAKIRVRQPLKTLWVGEKLEKDFLGLIEKEINVKKVEHKEGLKDKVKLDTKITSELKEEGILREIIRNIQEMRKKIGLKPKNKILVGY
ncbi:isoleucine--tRNA ligase, partial [Candidatus Roizmanbacteria bacterium CG03_land_8_20_14_0_80_39_12]